MKSRMWCAFCAILMFVVCPAVLADTHRDEDGGGDEYDYGGGSGSGWGASCSASAYANGSYPSSGAVRWASVYRYTDQGGWFKYTCSWGASALASYTDYNGSGASGSGGGTGSTPLGGVSVSASVSYPGPADDSDYPQGGTLESEWTYFYAYDGVSASSSCGAYASIGSSPNCAGGSGAPSRVLRKDGLQEARANHPAAPRTLRRRTASP